MIWILIEERRKLKQRLLNGGDDYDKVLRNHSYRHQDMQVKKSERGDKRDFLEKKAVTAEESANRSDSRAVYKIINEIIGKRRNLNGPIKDENGKRVTVPNEISEILGRKF